MRKSLKGGNYSLILQKILIIKLYYESQLDCELSEEDNAQECQLFWHVSISLSILPKCTESTN